MFYTTRIAVISILLGLNDKRINALADAYNRISAWRAAANAQQVALAAAGDALHLKHLQRQLALAEDRARDTRVAARDAAKARQEAEDNLMAARLGLPTIDPSLLD